MPTLILRVDLKGFLSKPVLVGVLITDPLELKSSSCLAAAFGHI